MATSRTFRQSREIWENWSSLTDMGIKLCRGHPHHASPRPANSAREGDVKPKRSIRSPCSGAPLPGFHRSQFPSDLIGVAHSPAYFAGALRRAEFFLEHAFAEKINNRRYGPARQSQVARRRRKSRASKAGASVTISHKDGRKFFKYGVCAAWRGDTRHRVGDIEAKYRALALRTRSLLGNLEQSLTAIRGCAIPKRCGADRLLR